jgi:peptide/nickel transport system substrate-binding protein
MGGRVFRARAYGIAAAACVVAAVTATAATHARAAVHTGNAGSSISIAIGSDPSGLDPQAYEDGNALSVYDNIAEPLITTDPVTNHLKPLLATSWNYVNSKTLRVKLRSGVKFSDGEPFNADAVVFSLKRLTNPKFATQQSDFFGTITRAKKINATTVDVVSSVPDATIPQSLSLIMIVPPKYVTQKGSAYFNSHPVGTGPYVFGSWSRGASVTLSSNTRYWGGKPSIANVKFVIMPEANVQLNALKTGQVDLATALSPQQLPQAPKQLKVAGPEHPMIILNQRSGPFANRNVRLAANYAVDRATIAARVYFGMAKPAMCEPFGPQTLGFNPKLKNYPYNPAKAKQLLAKSGNPHPSVTFIGEAGRWTNDLAAEQAVQGYLEAVGFKVKFESLAFASFLKQLLPNGNNPKMSRPDMLWTSTGDTTGDADQKLQTFYAPKGAATSVNDSVLFGLVGKEAATIARAKRTTLQQQALARACQQADFIYLVNNANTYGASKSLTWQPRYDEQLLVKAMRVAS